MPIESRKFRPVRPCEGCNAPTTGTPSTTDPTAVWPLCQTCKSAADRAIAAQVRGVAVAIAAGESLHTRYAKGVTRDRAEDTGTARLAADLAGPAKGVRYAAKLAADPGYRRRMEYNELDEIEQGLHDQIMGAAMNRWPPALLEHVRGVTRDIGLCGDVVASAVADWIKAQRPTKHGPACTCRPALIDGSWTCCGKSMRREQERTSDDPETGEQAGLRRWWHCDACHEIAGDTFTPQRELDDDRDDANLSELLERKAGGA